ncbi:MAG: polysaccharide deacetylase family protein [Clostridia bacterium]|nr:polysaccharide deacetylase family protein [Clostridia bacterium]
MIRKLYPHGKRKAFSVTYDDGVEQDVRFVDMLNRYGMKGTFNLNSGLMAQGFAWTHESGRIVKRLKPEIAASLYAGHEVASHTLTHPYMHELPREAIFRELSADKANLEMLFGREIRGFAVPFDYYSELIADCVREAGFAYARISEESGDFALRDDAYHWRATVFHCCAGLEDIVRRFTETDEELACLQIVGHAYDLDVEDRWDVMERVFANISRQNDILPMTTGELIEYVTAMRRAEIAGGYIRNDSPVSLWFDVDGAVCEIQSGGQMKTSD